MLLQEAPSLRLLRCDEALKRRNDPRQIAVLAWSEEHSALDDRRVHQSLIELMVFDSADAPHVVVKPDPGEFEKRNATTLVPQSGNWLTQSRPRTSEEL